MIKRLDRVLSKFNAKLLILRSTFGFSTPDTPTTFNLVRIGGVRYGEIMDIKCTTTPGAADSLHCVNASLSLPINH